MNMYDQTAQERLKEKIGYELWLLDFLSEATEDFEGGSSISTITLINRQPSTHVEIGDTAVICSGGVS